MKKLILFLFCTIFLSLTASGANYFVDFSKADNTGDGTTWETAKKTISAASALGGADNIYIKGGTFSTASQVAFVTNINYYGSCDAANTGTTTVRSTSDLDANGIVEPWEFTNPTVLNSTFGNYTAAFAGAAGTRLDGFVFTLTYTNNTTEAALFSGIGATVVFTNNTIRNCNIASLVTAGFFGLFLSISGTASNCLIENNKFAITSTATYNNGTGRGLVLLNSGAKASNFIIRNNLLNYNFSTVAPAAAANTSIVGLIVHLNGGGSGVVKNFVINNNEINYTGSTTPNLPIATRAAVLSFSATTATDSILNCTVANNKTTNVNSAGICINSSIVQLQNNVVFNNQNDALLSNMTIPVTTISDGGLVSNNITNGAGLTNATRITNNDNTQTATNNSAFLFSNPTTYIGLPVAYGGNPVGQSAVAADWRLTLGSYLAGKGVAASNIYDKAGNAFVAPRAVGAYDFVKQSQSITFSALTNKVYGAADYSPGATSPANSITYTSSNTAVATIVSNQIHIVGVGTTTITASQAATGFYTAAVDVTQNLTVTSALNYFVDFTKSDDTGTGVSWETAKKTIAAASALGTTGDNIYIKTGTLNTAALVDFVADRNYYGSCDAANTGTTTTRSTSDLDANGIVESWEFTNPTLISSTFYSTTAAITVASTLVDGFVFTHTINSAAASTPKFLIFSNTPIFRNNTIKNSSITYSNATAFSGATWNVLMNPHGTFSNNLVQNNSLTFNATVSYAGGTAYPFMYLSGITVSGSVIRNNKVTLNCALAASVSSNLNPFIYCDNNVSVKTILKNTIIHNNEVVYNGAGAYTTLPHAGMISLYEAGVTDSILNCTVANNKTTNAGASSSGGIDINFHLSSIGIQMYNNVAWNNQKDGVLSNYYAVAESGMAAGTLIKNNFSNGAGLTNATKISASDISQTVTDNTVFKFNTPTTTVGNTVDGSAELSDWRLASGSYLAGQGVAASNLYDKAGNAFVSPRAVGAYDFVRQSQSITFGALGVSIVGDADYSPGATSPGNSITYTSSNTAIATIVSSQIHIVGVGTTTITASQAATGFYTAATPVAQSLTVATAHNYFVDFSKANDSGNGTTWETAKKTVAAASALGAAGDNIYIKGGTLSTAALVAFIADRNYYGSCDPSNTGTATVRSVSDLDANGLVESWEFTNASQITSTYYVTSGAVTVAATIVDGFSFTHTVSSAAASSPIFLSFSNTPIFRNNTIMNCSITYSNASAFGGATWSVLMDPLGSFSNNLVQNNSLTFNAASTYDNGSAFPFLYMKGVTVAGCVIRNNKVTLNCAAATSVINNLYPFVTMFKHASVNTILKNTIIHNNEVVYSGAGAYTTLPNAGMVIVLESGPSDSILNCTLANNKVTNGAATATAGIYFNFHLNWVNGIQAYNNVAWNNQKDGVLNNYAAVAESGMIGTTLIKNNFSNHQELTNATKVSGSDYSQTATDNSQFKFVTPTTTIGNTVDGSSETSNWRLDATSYLVAKGVVGSNTTDKSGNAFATPRAIGAYENAKASQTITFGALSAKVQGDVNYSPGATSATSGINPITYTSSNTAVATIVGSQIHIVGVGSTTITASQAANSNYSPAADVTQGLTVNANPTQTISGADAAAVLTDASADVTISSTGTLTMNATKTVHNLTIAAGGKISFDPSTPYTLNVTGNVILKATNSSSFSAYLGAGGIAVSGTVSYDRMMDGTQWYFMAFPCDMLVGGIVKADGTPLTLGSTLYVKYYDGLSRANLNPTSNWKAVTGGVTPLKKDTGYIFGLPNNEGPYEVRFPLTTTILASESAHSVAVNENAGTHSAAATNLGWNLVGCPYVSKYTASGANVNYLTLFNGSTYDTYAKADVGLLSPFTAYFVQADAALAGTGITFDVSLRQQVKSVVYTDPSERIRLNLTTATGVDNTNFIIDSNQSTQYQIGQDMAKWLTTGTVKPQLYSVLGGVNYAYNALPLEQVQDLPLGMYAQTAGVATIGVDATQNLGLAQLLLTDKLTGTVTNLLASNYSFTASAGTNNNRFLLSAFDLATTNMLQTDGQTTVVSVVGRNLQVNRLDQNSRVRVYTPMGQLIVDCVTTSSSFETQLPNAGVYLVRIESGAKSWTKKVLVGK